MGEIPFPLNDAKPTWSALDGHAVAPVKLAIGFVGARNAIGEADSGKLIPLRFSTLLQDEFWQPKYIFNWLIVVIVPESDLMEHINANNYITIVLCIIAFPDKTTFTVYLAMQLDKTQAIDSKTLSGRRISGNPEIGFGKTMSKQVIICVDDETTVLRSLNAELPL